MAGEFGSIAGLDANVSGGMIGDDGMGDAVVMVPLHQSKLGGVDGHVI